ncbi:MAG: Txe/YoeB family addiction module toxin [Cyclobacteriaceae bacterium]
MNLTFDGEAFDDFCNWAIYDKRIFKKILEILKSISRTPYEGIGKPEPLKFDKSGYWSRRITHEHRLVYKVNDQNILIASCRGHYS